MIADGDAGQAGPFLAPLAANEGQIGGAPAHVDDQREARVADGAGRVHGRGALAREPVVERSLRFLDQPELAEPGQPCGLQRQRARALVERRRDGEHHVLRVERGLGVVVVPRRPHVGEERRARDHRAHLRHVVGCTPREDGRRAVDARMREPALGARHQPSRHLGAERAGELPDDVSPFAAWERRGLAPRQRARGLRELVGRRVVAQGVKQRPRLHLARGHELIDLEDPWGRRAVARPIRDHGVGRPEIDSDDVASVRRHRGEVIPRAGRAGCGVGTKVRDTVAA